MAGAGDHRGPGVVNSTPMIAADTTVLAADKDEPRHGTCAEVLHRYRGELVVPAAVVADASWMIKSRLGSPELGRDG